MPSNYDKANMAEVTRIATKLTGSLRGDGNGNIHGADRILAALGHPGYSVPFATAVLHRWMAGGQNLHNIVYGMRSA